MDELPVKSCGGPVESYGYPGRCSYCGAPLVSAFYFCVACATPYRDVEAMLPAMGPPRPSDGELIAKKAPHVATLFWTYFAVVLGTGIFSWFAFGRDGRLEAIVVGSVLMFIVTCVFASLHWPALAVQLKRSGFSRPAAWWAIAALAPLLAFNYFAFNWLARRAGVDEPELALTELGKPALILLICVFPAIIEEISFRGLVQHWLSVAVGPMKALLLASALFTVLHFSVLAAPYLFALGMVLGWAKWKTGSLYPSILVHFLHNFIVVEFFYP